MHRSASSIARRGSTVLSVLALVAGLLVLASRWSAGIEATQSLPGTAETSGCEEESWLALWNHLHDQPVFRAPTEAPFNFAYFNWGFYRTYGGILDLFGAEQLPPRIISAGRTITAVLGLLAASVWFLICQQLVKSEDKWPVLAWATFPVLGPISGWMLVTVRPDVGALLGEAVAFGVFITTRERYRALGLLLAGFAGYAAWSFKISNVGALCTIGFFLIWKRSWRDLGVFCTPVFAAMGLTLWLGGEVYRDALFGASFGQSPFHAANATAAFRHFLPTAAPLLIGIAVAAIWPKPRQENRTATPNNNHLSDHLTLGIIGSVVVTTMMGLAASKTGSWTYYYMPATLPLALLGISLAQRRDVLIPATAITALFALILQSGLLSGQWGKISLHESTLDLEKRWAVFSQLPEPRFSSDLRLNLPWLNPHSPPLVLSYDYQTLRQAEVPFQGDGLGGMIHRLELKGLLLPSQTGSTYDGAPLAPFDRTEPLHGWSAFVTQSP